MKWSLKASVVNRLLALNWNVLYSKWFGAAIFVCLIFGTVLWFFAQERLPRTIRIATGQRNGQYHRYGEALAAVIAKHVGADVEVIVTEGSGDNRELLAAGKTDLAIIQHGAVPMSDLAVIAPLYEDVVHVVARKGRGVTSVGDLSGKSVVLGTEGSGMRSSAMDILNQYHLKHEELGNKTDTYFMQLESDANLDAAIVTTGYVNADLQNLLASGEFELLALDDSDALSIRHAHLRPTTIPQGLYRGEVPPVPEGPIKTVATTAILVAGSEVPDLLVNAAVTALYEEYSLCESEDPQQQLPLMTATEARQWSLLPLHPVTQTYFEPYKGLILLKDFMESMVATKDLVFTLGAGFYVLWLWRRKVMQQNAAAVLARCRRRINTMLDETIRIESEQMTTDDPQLLRKYLDEVTRIKLRALDELAEEDLRGDQLFVIFLTQCSNLSRKIQLRISLPGASTETITSGVS